MVNTIRSTGQESRPAILDFLLLNPRVPMIEVLISIDDYLECQLYTKMSQVLVTEVLLIACLKS